MNTVWTRALIKSKPKSLFWNQTNGSISSGCSWPERDHLPPLKVPQGRSSMFGYSSAGNLLDESNPKIKTYFYGPGPMH